ncbi:MAG: GNAT family N-acetyltransferase [Bacteroidales bacterium]|nr:GNAT family N-acetyltransferase [Bacteroidales bacterium]
MITFNALADSDHARFAEDLFEEAFPEHERPPFDDLEQRDPTRFHFLVAENGDQPVGLLTYWTFPDLIYIEHFAIAEHLRNQGLGKATFLNFLSQQTEQVVLEVELPTTEEADHRLEFYASMGFFRNPFPYQQPPYRAGSRPVDMLLMSKYELDEDEFCEIRDLIYREVYHVAPANTPQ